MAALLRTNPVVGDAIIEFESQFADFQNDVAAHLAEALLSVFPGVKNFAVSCFEPTGPQSARRHLDIMTPPGVSEEREAARAKWGLEVVNEEDKALCENVQRGLRQRGYRQGYTLIDPDNGNLTEEAVRFFHRLYGERMGV